MRKFIMVLAGVLFLPVLATAQTMHYFHVQSGTGFFVNQQYVITNAHVVVGCNQVLIKGAVKETTAEVRVLDQQHDLALLQTASPPQEFAPLRFNIDDLKPGDRLFVIGYPGEQGIRGEFKVAEAQVQELGEHVQGDVGHFYISNVVDHGNSGGPVFDTSGNVIGVVVAKSELITINQQTHEKIAEKPVGVVIALTTLKQFLFDHGIYSEWTGSGLLYTNDYITQRAKNYIVNVQCRQPAPAPGGR